MLKTLINLVESNNTTRDSNGLEMRPFITSSNIIELPEFIVVKSCLVTPDDASLKNLSIAAQFGPPEISQTFPARSIDFRNNQATSTSHLKAFTANASVNVKPIVVHTEIQVDLSYPTRERAQQTNAIEINSVGIQCNMDDDSFLFQCNEQTASDNQPSLMTAKANYYEFYKTNVTAYSNGKVECLVCGEIAASEKAMYSHMAAHHTESIALCCYCGHQFQSAGLLSKHKCVVKNDYKKTKYQNITNHNHNLYCPSQDCRTVAISPLELFDHLNEHCGINFYNCKNCKKAFSTLGEMRYHIRLHPKCHQNQISRYTKRQFKFTREKVYQQRVFRVYTSVIRKFVVKQFLTRKNHFQHWTTNKRCQYCLKKCTNSLIFKTHIKRCQKLYRKRLFRKRASHLNIEQGNK